MKAITTLTAIAALIAGISLASAQNSGSMNSDKSSNATGNGKFCIEISKGGGKDCTYASMAACEKDAQPNGLQCSPNTSTTGSK